MFTPFEEHPHVVMEEHFKVRLEQDNQGLTISAYSRLSPVGNSDGALCTLPPCYNAALCLSYFSDCAPTC